MTTPTTLAEQIETGARALWDNNPHGPTSWDDVATHWPTTAHQHREAALEVIAAVAPLIEQAVRERVAADIEALSAVDDHGTIQGIAWAGGWRTALAHAARIARGAGDE